MLRKFTFLILAGICVWQQWRIQGQQELIADLIHGLQHDEQVLNDIVFDAPPPPNLPREWALQAIAHPREQ